MLKEQLIKWLYSSLPENRRANLTKSLHGSLPSHSHNYPIESLTELLGKSRDAISNPDAVDDIQRQRLLGLLDETLAGGARDSVDQCKDKHLKVMIDAYEKTLSPLVREHPEEDVRHYGIEAAYEALMKELKPKE